MGKKMIDRKNSVINQNDFENSSSQYGQQLLRDSEAWQLSVLIPYIDRKQLRKYDIPFSLINDGYLYTNNI